MQERNVSNATHARPDRSGHYSARRHEGEHRQRGYQHDVRDSDIWLHLFQRWSNTFQRADCRRLRREFELREFGIAS
jgi:hypothetical protein